MLDILPLFLYNAFIESDQVIIKEGERVQFMTKWIKAVLIIVSLTSFCSGVFADAIWTNASPTNNFWTNGANWSGTPNITTAVQVDLLTPNQCLVADGMAAEAKVVKIGNTLSTPGTLEMTGGSLETNGFFKVGLNSDDSMGISSFLMSGGTVNIPSKFFTIAEVGLSHGYVELSGDAVVTGVSGYKVGNHNGGLSTDPAVGEMVVKGNASFSCNDAQVGNNPGGDGTLTIKENGSFTCYGNLTIAKSVDTVGHIQLDGGTLNLGGLLMGDGQHSMDITDGIMILPGDQTGTINSYKNAGYLTAFGGSGTVYVNYDGINTIVSAQFLVVAPAYNPLPSHTQSEVAPDADLSWIAGSGALQHQLYFGTSPIDVQNATPADPRGVFVGTFELNENLYDLPLLDTETTYYWRVDEINGPDMINGFLWYFTTGDGRASNPAPQDDEVFVSVSQTLSWNSGLENGEHDIYIGTDPVAVQNATTASPEYAGTTSDSSFSPELELSTTYFWRVDCVHPEQVYPGDVWSFTTTDAFDILLDDFDPYTTTVQMKSNWIDGSTNGTGAVITLETNPNNTYHYNAMRLDFDNTASNYQSLARRTFSQPQDWTVGGIETLSFWYLGHAQAEKLYVEISDSSTSASVFMSGPGIKDDVFWQNINILLVDFTGIDFSDVTSITVGIISDAAAQGVGTVYFDQFGVYPPRCIDGYKPAADFTGDCIVDLNDFDYLMRFWLVSGYDVTAQEPSAANLVMHLPFDETSGTVAIDVSGNNAHGYLTAPGSDNWDAGGYVNGCLDFDGTFYVSVFNNIHANMTAGCTISFWVNVPASYAQNDPAFLEFGSGEKPGGGNDYDWKSISATIHPDDYTGRWVHYALVKDVNAGTLDVYEDGVLVERQYGADLPLTGAAGTVIGKDLHANNYFIGKLDEMQVYSVPLTPGEVLYLARGLGVQASQPLSPAISPIDPAADGEMNFADFAKLADQWTRQILWP